tara:strand:+ start:3310 stop:3666 length:357 start_codon:yes stop_codon:yes gene_type:complete
MIAIYIWLLSGIFIFLSLLLIRLYGYTLHITKNKYFWIILHILWFAWGGAILPLNFQPLLFIFSIVFEIFEIIGCSYTKHLCSNLNPNKIKVMFHDIIMNLSAQIVGISLSGRLMNYL